ncbi:hypothetical protein BU16DRAFT_619196 [Lophium mytilinum]|uniref:Cryptic loci regulator 2 N-terminal domain-containing protein n=1 Tax=Lophium mytilinum TaxID=390894 RepID=A0A6A6QP42_9PEZI|nr:hypothetical protein BU16DRAFT_619196 [Lophium mytilinum]
MTRFYPLHIARSDGKTEIPTRTGKQQNGPTKEQLDRTPDAKGMQDYYRELGPQEVKHMDWRRKLAGMLMREIGSPQDKDKATTSILYEFPENYRLYEHIKSSGPVGEGNRSHRSKNHSGGGHDRQDAYLYGHPMGPRKRFRSPADFFPHLLWLTTDKDGDQDNCSCKICCPEEIEGDKTAKDKEKASTPAPSIKKEEGSTKSPAIGKAALSENVRRMSINPSQPTTSKPSTPNPLDGHIRTNSLAQRVTAPTPSPLPQPRSRDQQFDAEYNRFIFRSGELVWHNRGSAWGLGVIIRRWMQTELRNYLIQPLSHPLQHPHTSIIDQESLLRPWLAWSAPPCTTPYLLSRSLLYQQVDWHGLLTEKYGHGGDVEVDASILGAKAIDGTYTPFELLRTSVTQNGFEERYFNGMYLGAEKIWAGEPVRLRIGSGSDIMIVTAILERRQPQTTSSSAVPLPTPTVAYFVGDVYTFISRTSPSRTQVPDIPNFSALPLRVREDLRWRNSLTLPALGSYGLWNLVSPQARVEITDIKGRWYESSMLAPILQPDSDCRAEVVRGNGDVGTWMNSRGDSSNALNRIDQRVSAFGGAVPHGTNVVDGIDPPPPPPPQPLQQQHQPALSGDVAMLDDYLNLDGIDADPLSGFAQGFGNAGWGN